MSVFVKMNPGMIRLYLDVYEGKSPCAPTSNVDLRQLVAWGLIAESQGDDFERGTGWCVTPRGIAVVGDHLCASLEVTDTYLIQVNE